MKVLLFEFIAEVTNQRQSMIYPETCSSFLERIEDHVLNMFFVSCSFHFLTRLKMFQSNVDAETKDAAEKY